MDVLFSCDLSGFGGSSRLLLHQLPLQHACCACLAPVAAFGTVWSSISLCMSFLVVLYFRFRCLLHAAYTATPSTGTLLDLCVFCRRVHRPFALQFSGVGFCHSEFFVEYGFLDVFFRFPCSFYFIPLYFRAGVLARGAEH